MDDRDIVIEPYNGQWLAFYRGQRYRRVIADTPQLARELLAESAREQQPSPISVAQGRKRGWPIALTACAVAIVVIALLVMFPRPAVRVHTHPTVAANTTTAIVPVRHHIWAHHRRRSQHPTLSGSKGE